MDTNGHLLTHISGRIRLEQDEISEDKVGRDELSVSSVENHNFSQKVFLLHDTSVFLILLCIIRCSWNGDLIQKKANKADISLC